MCASLQSRACQQPDSSRPHGEPVSENLHSDKDKERSRGHEPLGRVDRDDVPRVLVGEELSRDGTEKAEDDEPE
jgi:hypothetical protein